MEPSPVWAFDLCSVDVSRELYAPKGAGRAILVDPDQFFLTDRYRLLLRASEAVHAVAEPSTLYELQPPEEPFVAVLSRALGTFQLSAGTEYVRHRWPQARILIVGQAFRHLEDHLYDETVSSSASDEETLIAVERWRGVR